MEKAEIEILTKEINKYARSFKKVPRVRFVIEDFRNIEIKAREGIALSHDNEEIKKRFEEILTSQQLVKKEKGKGLEDCLKKIRRLVLEIQVLLNRL